MVPPVSDLPVLSWLFVSALPTNILPTGGLFMRGGRLLSSEPFASLQFLQSQSPYPLPMISSKHTFPLRGSILLPQYLPILIRKEVIIMEPFTQRHESKIAGIIDCLDRVIITGTVPGICFADGMTGYLYANKIRIFDYPKWAEPLRDEIRTNAEHVAHENGIQFIHPDLGLCHLRVPTWAPFRLQFYFNGHNQLANKLLNNGVDFTMLDNAFINIGDLFSLPPAGGTP